MALVLSGDSPSISGTYQGGVVTSGTAVASTSGTSIDFTSIPSWVKRITVMFVGVSGSGSSQFVAQLGTSSSVETSGYAGGVGSSSTGANFSSNFQLIAQANGAANTWHGSIVFNKQDGNTWLGTSQLMVASGAGSASFQSGAGSKTLSGTLDRVRVTTVNGTDTFDAGSINILYE